MLRKKRVLCVAAVAINAAPLVRSAVGVTLPVGSAMRADLSPRDLRGRCRGSRGCVAWWARSRASAGIGSGGRSVNEGGAVAACAAGMHTARGPQENCYNARVPDIWGCPCGSHHDKTTRSRHVRPNVPISPKTTQSTLGS